MADKIIIEVGLDNGEYAKRAEETIKKIQDLKVQQALLTTQGKKDSLQYNQNKLALVELGRELKANTALSQNYEDSITGLRSTLSILNAQWLKLSQAQRENTDEGKALSAQIKATSDKLKEQESGVGNNTRNVGNYREEVRGAIADLIPFGNQIMDAAGKAQSLSGGIFTAGKSLGGFKVALAATGIGLIIPLVASLIGFLSKFDPIIDKVEQAFAGLGAGLNTLAMTVVNFFQNIKSLGDLLSKVGKFLSDPIGSFKELRSAMAEAANAAIDLKKAQQDQEDQMKIQEVSNAKAEQQIQQLMLQARNRALSEKERTRLLQEAGRIDKQNFDERTRLANEELRQAQRTIAIKAGLSAKEQERLKKEGLAYAFTLKDRAAVTDEEIDQLQKAEISKVDILKESTNRQEKIQNQRDALAEKEAAKAEKLAKARQEQAEKAKEAEEERIASLVRTNQIILTERQKELSSINAEINEKIEKYKKYGRATEQLEIERNARLKELHERFHEEDLRAIEENNRQIQDLTVASIKDATEREIAQITLNNQRRLAEQDKVVADLRERVEKGEKGLTEIIKSELDLRQAIIEDNARIKSAKLDEYGQLELQKAQELQLALAQMEVDNAGTPVDRLLALQSQLDQEYEIKIANAQRLNEDTYLIHEEFKNRQKELDADSVQFAIDQYNNMGDSFQEIVGKNAFAAKVAADLQMKANAGIQLQNNILIIQEQVKAIASQGKLPFPANLVAIASTLAALGGAIASAKKLFTLPKFARGIIGFKSDNRGAIVSGPGSETSDSINSQLSNGESVINAKSTRMFAPVLDFINRAGGGRPLVGPGSSGYKSSVFPGYATGGIYGGLTGSSVSQNVVNPNEIAAAVGAEISKLTIVTDVRQIVSATEVHNTAIGNSVF